MARYDPDSMPARFLRGEPLALTEVERWVRAVLADRGRVALDAGEPSDLRQEVLRAVFLNLKRGLFDHSMSFRAYVKSIARYMTLRSTRRAYSRANAALEATVPPDSERILIAHLDACRALKQCSDESRSLLTSYFYERRSYAEIARMKGLPVGTVKSRLFRCLEQLNRDLDRGAMRPRRRHRRRRPRPAAKP